MLALAGLAFVIGAIAGASHSPSYAHELAERFTAAWARSDYASMYSDIDTEARREVTPSEFASSYRSALTTATATATGLRVTGKARDARGDGGGGDDSNSNSSDDVEVPVRVQTHLFGTLSSDFRLPIQGSGSATRIAWSRSLTFPGLRPGERLTRHTTLPRRATLLARDGTVLAEGAAVEAGQRTSPLGSFASAVVGTVGPIPPARLHELEAEGVPANAIVGVSGLELALDSSLRGAPGGELLAEDGQTGAGSGAGAGSGVGAGSGAGADSGTSADSGTGTSASARVLATATPKAASAVRTTVSPSVQRAAVTALGAQLGGVVAMAPATGQILAVAGIGLDDLQPPGSTFKMITLTAVLQAGLATPKTVFPYATYATLDGVKLNNANGEECGGTLALAFAVSCNSVFAPLGAKLGAARLVATAERYGFNHSPGVPGAVESTLPPAAQIQGQLDIGSTAIGQGEVQASALEMATVAATIADGGRRPQPTFDPSAAHARGEGTLVSSAAVAHTVRSLMIGVVREGTGTAAAIPGVTVAGKTGTAELKTASTCTPSAETSTKEEQGSAGEKSASESCGSAEAEASNTDAWFASFAPAFAPRIVVGVLLVQDGAGGATAAPVARQVLEAGLSASR